MNLHNLDIVIPYKHSFSNELRYCLRSLSNIPHRYVYVVGDNPKMKVRHIRYVQTVNIASNTLRIINLAVRNPEVSEDFIYMHDDMYIMQAVDSIPVHHRGYYHDILAEYAQRNKDNFYVGRMRHTYEKLQSLGIENPLCYELHIPFVINKSKWRSVASHITAQTNKLSMYGNLNKIGGTKIDDVKVRLRDVVPDNIFISTHDSTFNVNQVGKLIKSRFPERSKYEYNV